MCPLAAPQLADSMDPSIPTICHSLWHACSNAMHGYGCPVLEKSSAYIRPFGVHVQHKHIQVEVQTEVYTEFIVGLLHFVGANARLVFYVLFGDAIILSLSVRNKSV